MLLCGKWQNGPKMAHKDPQVGEIYGPKYKLRNEPLTKSLGPFFSGEMTQNNQMIAFFMLSWGIWAPPNGPKKVHKGPQVGGM